MKEMVNFKKFNPSRRAFLQKSIVGISAYPFIGATQETDNGNNFEVINTTIAIPHLPDQFKGFRIGMMSDIHSSVFMNKEDMDGYVSAMNALNTDLIVVTGDFVNSQTEEVYQF
jgi:hypothetical protein